MPTDESTSSGTRGRWPAPSEALARSARPAALAQSGELRGAAVRFGYRVGSLGFLVGRGVLSELLPNPATYPIPNVPAALRGFVNRQGALVPVWDLHVLLDAAPAPKARESVLLLGRGESRIGLVIDGLPRSLKQLEPVSRLPAPPEVLREHVQGAYIADGTLWMEFDCEGLLRAQAQQAMA
jgi:chemotaxis signal transduction protein